MRLITYNVFEGAQDTFSEVLATVQTAQPDFLIINEANGFERDGKLEALAEVGLPYYHLEQCGDGADYHVALLSDQPFTEQIQAIRPLARAAILAILKLPVFGDVALVGTHLTPYSETQRRKEAGLILARVAPYINAMLAGDFNALSPQDDLPDDLYQRLTPSQRRKFGSKGELSFATIQAILDDGFADAAVLMGKNDVPTVPTAANADPDHAPLRLDYIFVRGKLASAVTNYAVEINDLTNVASDHFPAIVEFGDTL